MEPKTVDEYLNLLDEGKRLALQHVRELILNSAEGVTELISYKVPCFKIDGEWLLTIAGFTNHCSVVCMDQSVLDSLKDELKGYKTSGTTIHFTPEKPLPDAFLKHLIDIRLKQGRERKERKLAAKKAKAEEKAAAKKMAKAGK